MPEGHYLPLLETEINDIYFNEDNTYATTIMGVFQQSDQETTNQLEHHIMAKTMMPQEGDDRNILWWGGRRYSSYKSNISVK